MEGNKRGDKERQLLDYADRISRNNEGRIAVHLHLSRLAKRYQLDHHLRVAVAVFDPLLMRHDGQLFLLTTNDIIVICKNPETRAMEETVARVRSLFADDPCTDTSDGTDRFVSWYNLTIDFDAFYQLCQRLQSEIEEYQPGSYNSLSAAESAAGPSNADKRVKPITPQLLGRLVDQLASMDLSALVRRQPVCAIAPGGLPKPVFNELFVSIHNLQRTVIPDSSLTDSNTLFRHLTQCLDQRILRYLPEVEGSIPLSTSVNINVETILSPEFLMFDHRLRGQTRKTIILELQLSDIFEHMADFTFARNFIRNRGYRICVDGLNHQTLPLVDKARLGLDMMKLVWAADIFERISKKRRQEIANIVRHVGPASVILTRCDTQNAIDFGHSLGINLFQGHQVDKILSDRANPMNQLRAQAAAGG